MPHIHLARGHCGQVAGVDGQTLQRHTGGQILGLCGALPEAAVAVCSCLPCTSSTVKA